MEEDIKILEELKDNVELGFGGWVNRLRSEEKQALENLLKAYKEQEEHIKKFYQGEIFTAKQLKNIEQNQKKYFINKQIVKEKIEEINKMLRKSHKKPQRLTVGEMMLVKTVLKELLEEEKQNDSR